MPTYVMIEFIRDVIESDIIHIKGRTNIVWRTIYSTGEKLSINIYKAHEFIKEGYAKYVH